MRGAKRRLAAGEANAGELRAIPSYCKFMNLGGKMDDQELLSTLRGIVARIDDEVEVEMRRPKFGREMFRVRLSKWGIPTVLEISLQEIVNARPDDTELRARLEEAIEGIRQRAQWKVIVKGRVGMLRPFLCNLAAEQGLSADPSSGRPDGTRGEWDFASFRINRRDAEGRSYSVGTIALQGLPEQRAEIAFRRTAGGKLPPKEAQEQFIAFYNKLVDRLEELGFLDGTPPPKRPIGFQHD